MDTFKEKNKQLIKKYNGSVALALKEYLIKELSDKMKQQGKCRMKKEMTENIKKVHELLRVYKKKEYNGFKEVIEKFRDKYDPDESLSCFEVADIQFAFNNRELINLLKKRGQYITNMNKDGIRKVEKKINKYLHSPKG